MISLQEMLIKKNRTIDIDSIRKDEIIDFITKNYHLFKMTGFNKSQVSFINKYDGYDNFIHIKYNIVDVDCCLHLKNNKTRNLTNELFKFGKVDGDFICDYCELTSFEGAPYEVTGNFYCGCNPIKNLIGSPKIVGGNFDCRNCWYLESLEGSPEKADSYILYNCEKLKSLKGITQDINQYIDCRLCNSLPNLEGISDKFKGLVSCGFIPSVQGLPTNASIYIEIPSWSKYLKKYINTIDQFDQIEPGKIKKQLTTKYRNIFNKVTNIRI